MKPNITKYGKLSLRPFISKRLIKIFLFSFIGLLLTSCVKNENPPVITDQEFTVDENSPIGTIIGAVDAIDLDENSILGFSILDGNTNSTFSIGESTGLLSVSNPSTLDYEKINDFTLTIQVNDNHPVEPKVSEAIIKIYLNDLNEFAPVLVDHLFQMKEFPKKDSLIGKINASDEDTGQSLIFAIESGNDDHAINIDSLSGEIFVANSTLFDLDLNQSIKCMISVLDNHPSAPRKTYALLTIEIKDGDVTIYNITGNIQKGPFIQGSVITVFELNKLQEPTGRTFLTTIEDNSGAFSLNNIELESNYVQLKADGFYFNERSGELSNAQLTLQGISSISNSNTININILTHLEKGRIETLIDQGLPFEEAKHQAQQELLNMFAIELPDIRDSELLDISKINDDNGALLAISVIVQGFRSDAEFSEILASIIQDFKPDGSLDDETLQSNLINHAKVLSSADIRSNLENRYASLGVAANIPDFEKYLSNFIDNSGYLITNSIPYPQNGSVGANILFPSSIEFISNVDYNMTATLPEGTSLKIRLSGGSWYYMVLPIGPKNWSPSSYDADSKSQTFTSIEPGTDCELQLHFAGPIVFNDSINEPYIINDYILVEYFENMSDSPTFVKTIHLEK